MIALSSFINKWLQNRTASPSHFSNENEIKADPQLLKGYVRRITETRKPRSYDHPEILNELSAEFFSHFRDYGFEVEYQSFKAGGTVYRNVIARRGPETAPRLVIGAHYDVAGHQPGADDNASGVAGLLELARLVQERKPELRHRLELVAYCLEEPPFFATNEMGSAVHARSLKEQKAEVSLMMSLEMIGYFTDQPETQSFPVSALKYIYPQTGNFIAVVGEINAVRMTKKIKNLMAQAKDLKVEAINAPRSLPGVDFSDHRNYWNLSYPAVMITDTAFFRNPFYHTAQDKLETLNYEQMAHVVEGVYKVLTDFH